MKKYLLLLLLIVLVVLQKANAQTPVAYYPFNGNVNDAVGSNNGTVNGATLTTDRFGNANRAYSFDGVDDNINIGNNSAIRPTTQLTISSWFNLQNEAGAITGRSILSCTDDGGWNFWYDKTTNKIQAFLRRNGSYSVIETNATPYIGLWNHITMTYNGQVTRLYINGVLIGSNDAGGVFPIQYNNTVNTLIGAEPAAAFTIDPNYYFQGAIDEVKIFNTALTATQVQNEYLSGNNYGSQFNNSVKINGVNDAITIPNNAAINFGTGNFAVELWMKSPANNKRELILDKRDDGCVGTGAMWGIEKLVDNSVNFFLNVSGGGLTYVVNISNSADNNWHHLSFVREGINMLAYKDGILAGTISTSVVRNVSNTANLGIGTGPCGPFIAGGGFPTGNLDEIRLWNTARTQAQIVANMNSQLTGTEVGLVGYWDMNRNGQGAGLTVDNKCVATGAALNGTTVGTASTPIFAPAVTQQKPGSGNAISFDGVDDNIVTSSLLVPSAGDFTVDFWINDRNNTSGYKEFISQGVTGNAPFYIGTTTGTGLIRCGDTWLNTGVVMPLNRWIHLTLVKSGTNGILYLDGIQVSTQTNYFIGVGGSNTTIGRQYGGLSEFMDASMDEVRIWNTALTQAQIRDRMCRKITSSDALYPNLVVYYNFDESTGTTAFDGTANNNNGTLTNSPTRVTSGAAIGTASSHDYVNATKTTSLTHPSGESFTVTSSSGNPDGIHIYRVDEQPNTLSGTQGVAGNNKYFGVFQAGGASPTYQAVYNYNGNPGVNAGNENTLALFKRTNNAAASWANGTATLNTTAKTLTLTGESTEYILGSTGSPLPLNLISFTGSRQNKNVQLQWKTTQEINLEKFELQRSDDGNLFTTITSISAGSSNYNYLDADVFTIRQTCYYRLKSIDRDGKFVYSAIIRFAAQTNTGKLTLFPNPVNDVLSISGLTANSTLRLITMDGKIIWQQNIQTQSAILPMGNYPNGVYMLQYSDGTRVLTEKIIKQ
jgi:Concanavalin A-like lectin/glucanases superfamily/Secretion system C-terminal sorting domain